MKEKILLTIVLIYGSLFFAEAQSQWDIRLTRSSLDCSVNRVCYQLEVSNTSGSDWALGDQNYRLFFDGDLMTVTSVASLLPSGIYGTAVIDQNTKISGMGQEAASPLDDIDDNLGFLDFNIAQKDKSNPSLAQQLTAGTFTPAAEICVDADASVINDASGGTCLSFYHSRPSTSGSITNQYTVISENDGANSTISTTGVNYDDLTSADGTEACPGASCLTRQWDIRLVQSSLDCAANHVCYRLEVSNTSGSDWALGDQNYRLFFDGDLMTVTSVASLLPGTIYGAAVTDMNSKYSGTGQEASSPLDDIDDNLGFLDFNIPQKDKSNPAAAQQLVTGIFTPVAEICVDADTSVINDTSNSECLSFYHSRPLTAGTFTNQYTVLTQHDGVNSTAPTSGVNYNDLTSAGGPNSGVCLWTQCNCKMTCMPVTIENSN